jgi:hypothetical protein
MVEKLEINGRKSEHKVGAIDSAFWSKSWQ